VVKNHCGLSHNRSGTIYQCYFTYGFPVTITVTVIDLQFLYLFQSFILHNICISAWK